MKTNKGKQEQLTPQELREIWARLRAASKGPWEVAPGPAGGIISHGPCVWTGDTSTLAAQLSPERYCVCCVDGPDWDVNEAGSHEHADAQAQADAALIAHARNDIERLLLHIGITKA